MTQARKANRPKPQLTRKHETPGGGSARGERGSGGEEGGVSGGKIEGWNPVEVTLMKLASLLSRGREYQRGAS